MVSWVVCFSPNQALKAWGREEKGKGAEYSDHGERQGQPISTPGKKFPMKKSNFITRGRRGC